MESTKKVAKVAKIFYCEKCDYKCSKKFNFDKHLETDKHKRATNQSCINNDVAKVAEPKIDVQSVKKYVCNIHTTWLISGTLVLIMTKTHLGTPKRAGIVNSCVNSNSRIRGKMLKQ